MLSPLFYPPGTKRRFAAITKLGVIVDRAPLKIKA